MLEGISGAGWLVIVCSLFLGFGLVRFVLVSRRDEHSGCASIQPVPGENLDAQPHWTEVLGLDADASVEEIQINYRRVLTQNHPERVAELGPELRALAQEMTQRVERAYRDAMTNRA